MQRAEITGFVLAGGKSSRMGQDKALLEFQGQSLLAHMLKLITPFCSNTFISANNLEYQSFGADLIPDVYQGKGPISGIFSALSASCSDWNLIVSVDVPLVNPELLQYLVDSRNSYDAVVPVHLHGNEPLIALYHRCVIPALQEMIEMKDFKLTNLFPHINTNYLDCNFLVEKYPQLFLNLNRQEDYRAIQAPDF